MHTREINLRRLAHERIEAGELPPDRHGLTRDGTGRNRPCVLCVVHRSCSKKSNASWSAICLRALLSSTWRATPSGSLNR
jgi:hypothetical protein